MRAPHYYDGLLQRRAGNTEKEIADFRKVVEMFPQSRDARRELGITYYQQNDNTNAVEQFEALQKIDPDDLRRTTTCPFFIAAWAGRRRLRSSRPCLSTRRSIQAHPLILSTIFALHPEISTESIPWHMHSDLREKTEVGVAKNGK